MDWSLDPLTRFIAQVIAIVLVARVLGRMARSLEQPMVVAEIAAGIVLGPSLLGWILPDLSAALFARESLVLLQVVSNLGLAFFMFLIGLEFDPRLLRGRGQASIVIAQSTFLVPLGLGIVLALYLYPAWAEPGVPVAIFALFMGAALTNTAFPVLASILSERRLLRSRLGSVTIACAAIDDVIGWCLLAFVVAWSRAKGIATASLTTLLAFGYIAVMVWVVRPLLVRLAAKVTGSSLSHDLIAVVMLLLLASSSATELIGIHALFGAFLLGAILPRDGGLAHALAEKLEVVVVVVLVPLFFAYSGLRTQIGLLDSSAAWVTCGLIILVACIGKWGAGTLAARLTGMTWRESGALGVLMNTRGLMVLIVLNIGLDLGVISPTLFTMMVLMALFTTVVATPVLDRVYPSTQHVRDLLARSASGTKTDHEPQAEPFTMLVCIADETSGRGLLDMAAALAGTRSESSVQALHLLRPGDSAAPIDPRSDELGAMLKHVSFVSADPAQEICRVAKVKGADLVLMGRRGARDDRLLGRTVHRVLEESSDMVAVFLDGGPSRIRNVAVHVFGTVHDEATLQLARRLEDGGAHITVVRGFQEQRGESFGPFAGRANVRHDLVVTSLIDEGASAPRFARACLEQCARGVSVLLVRSPLGRPDQRGDS